MIKVTLKRSQKRKTPKRKHFLLFPSSTPFTKITLPQSLDFLHHVVRKFKTRVAKKLPLGGPCFVEYSFDRFF